MNHDDPERRIPDFEVWQAERWRPQPPPPYFAEQAAAEPRPRSKSFVPSSRWWWPVVVVWSAWTLFLMGLGVHDFLEYRSGTPAVATIVECETRRPNSDVDCTVRWYDDGRALTGELHRVTDHPPIGGRADVHVKGDDAYVATSGRDGFIAGAIGAGVMLVLYAVFLLQHRRGGRQQLRPTAA